MAKAKEKKPLAKTEWVQSFNLIGRAKVNEYTFKTDEHSTKSDWIYNALNLGIDCGDKHGTVYCEMSGGYASEKDNVIYVHGQKEDKTDDFKDQFTIDFNDRFDAKIIGKLGDFCFLNIGLQKTDKDKTHVAKFLHAYDAIAYIQEHLEDGMIVNVKGSLKYSEYNDTIQCKKEISSIFLSKKEPEDFAANFTQTILIDKDSAGKVDKDKLVLPITGIVLEKFKEYNGHDLTQKGKVKGGQLVPLYKEFEYPIDITKPEKVKKAKDILFTVKKGYNQVTFEGEFVEGGAVVTATEDDIPADIKELIEIGAYTLEQALAKCSENGNKSRRMLLIRPLIKMVEKDGVKTPVIQKKENEYSDEDLDLPFLMKAVEDDDLPFETEDETEEDSDAVVTDDSWLDNL